MTRQPPESENELLKEWFRRIRESQFAHYEAAKSLLRKKYLLGIPVVLLTAFTGTSVFATLSSKPNIHFQVLVGCVSVLAAVLASLQLFLHHQERAEKHRSVAGRYGSLRREIEKLLASSQSHFEKDKLDLLKEKIDYLSEEAPEISPKIWKKTETILVDR
jgi:hypothetical protein